MPESTKRKTASDILIDRFLKDVDEKQSMPWQRPYERYNAFNYFSLNSYSGFNRLILPFGEYITRNQINEYNKSHSTQYRFKKGIEWFPVVFFKQDEKEISVKELMECLPDVDVSKTGFLGTDERWSYYEFNGKYVKRRNILRYYEVADRKWFVDSEGNCLPSRIETGEVVITLSEPKAVLDSYIKRSGIHVTYDSADVPCYIPLLDTVELNPHVKEESKWFSTAFHEFAHSTGHASRLNRIGINTPKGISSKERENIYAVEECVAEIAASLCCAECGIYDFETSESRNYENNIAYVQSWKRRVKDWGKEFIYIVSQADKAFNYIMNMEI